METDSKVPIETKRNKIYRCCRYLSRHLNSKSAILTQLVLHTGISKSPINVAISNSGQVLLVDQLNGGLLNQIDTSAWLGSQCIQSPSFFPQSDFWIQ